MSVVAPLGFRAAGVAAGIKTDGARDVAVVVADTTAVGAALLTMNRAAAAPVIVSREHLAASHRFRAVVLNSGCANAATGSRGLAAARLVASTAAKELAVDPEEILVCSTGPIGTYLPEQETVAGVLAALETAADDADAGAAAAEAIMTTDTRPKTTVVRADGFVVGGMAKGAGMIRPDMATMLAVLTTDAVVDPDRLADALRTAAEPSFHSLDVDGCPSTNDTVVVLASGASGVEPDPLDLTGALTAASVHLAEQIVADAEGASRVVAIEVTGAVDDGSARVAGRTMADSALVRAAFYGGDPNWGRLLAALGAGAVEFDPRRVAVWFQGIQVAEEGRPAGHDVAELQRRMEATELEVRVDLGMGVGRALVWTTDLTPEYVRFNGEPS